MTKPDSMRDLIREAAWFFHPDGGHDWGDGPDRWTAVVGNYSDLVGRTLAIRRWKGTDGLFQVRLGYGKEYKLEVT